MTIARSTLRLMLAWVAMLLAQMAVGMVVHVNSPSAPNAMKWMLLSNAITVAALWAAALRSDWRDWKLLAALYLIPVGIATVNFIEGVIFLPNAPIDWRGVMIFTVQAQALAALLWWLIYRSAPVVEAESGPLPHRSFGQMAWRFVLCAVCYLVLYFSAGMIVFPFVRDFYATQHIPSPGQIAALQILLRGPVFVLVCLTLLRMVRLPRLTGALAVGLLFTLLSGVAALVVPNVAFPDAVRWAHFCEVTSSNFVFGYVVGWIWGRAQHVRQLAHVHA